MPRRRFGRTNLQMPVYTCGGMRYQQAWTDCEPGKIESSGQQNLEACIRRALELGINHIETARGYGTSEMQLGRILPNLPRDELIVQTKVAPCKDPAEFLSEFNKSMDYLNLDYVDLLGMHGINNREILGWALEGCVDVAKQLQAEGRVRHIGFSTHAYTDLICDAIRSDAFDYVNLHWYFVNDLNRQAIEAAAKQDMGVFIISPSDKGGKLYEPSPKLAELCAPFSPMVFNDLYCLANPHVHTLSHGAARPTDFDEHMKALEFYDRIPDVIAPIEQRLRDEISRMCGNDWESTYANGIPEHTEIPGGVNVMEILRLWTYAHSLDLVEWGKMRYNLLGNADHWFPGEQMGAVSDVAEVVNACSESPHSDRMGDILTATHKLLHAEEVQRLSESD